MHITWGTASRVWWSYIWRQTLIVLALYALLHFVPDSTSKPIQLVLGLAIWLIFLGTNIYFVSKCFNRTYDKSFSVELRSIRNHELVVMTKRNALRLWWSRTWRSIVYSVGVGLLVGLILKLLSNGLLSEQLKPAIALIAVICIDITCFRKLLEIRYSDWKIFVQPSNNKESSVA